MQNELIRLLAEISESNPELRICQIISNAAKLGGWNPDDIFYCSDAILLDGLKKIYTTN